MPERDELDTDMLLVMLESLLAPRCPYSTAELLDALLDAEGDINSAATKLRGVGSSGFIKRTPPKKRTSGGGHLDKWLEPKAKKRKPRNNTGDRKNSPSDKAIEVADDESPLEMPSDSTLQPELEAFQYERMIVGSTKGKEREPAPTSLAKVSAFDILRPPPPSTPSAPRLAPMDLGTPDLVAQYTPTTIHTSILPQELACRLFYALLDESGKTWRRSKWYIADKLVESPHLTSFYVRDPGSGEWNEAAQYW